MRINKINLRNFRNYQNLTLQFAPGINVLSGPNGAGKTNIVEAIFYLAFASSFRTNEDVDLINNNQPLAYLEGVFSNGKYPQKVQIELQAAGKKIAVNNHGIRRLSELNDVANILVFTPKDVLFFDDAPRIRRRYLDTNIAKNANYYLRTLLTAEKALKERNRLLKHANPDRTHLEITTEKLIQASEIIVNYRAEYVTHLQKTFNAVLAKITDGLQEVKLRYLPFVNLGDNWQERAKTAYQRTLSYDLEHHGTSIGYQREDIVAEINDQPITATASQGQKRLIAIAIKLAPYFLITEEEKKPIVILDDGLSELDEKHRRKVLEFLTPLNQTFITVTQFNEPCATHYVINNNQSVTRKETI